MVFEGADSILEREARALDLADQLLKLLVCVGNVLRYGVQDEDSVRDNLNGVSESLFIPLDVSIQAITSFSFLIVSRNPSISW